VPAQRGHGIAILVVTGLITVQSIVTAIWPAASFASEPQAVSSGGYDATQGLGLLGVVAWLLVAPWMATAARTAAANGYTLKHRPWVAWWGWVIPIWNLWAPFRFMKDATQGFAVRNLGIWWATWIVGTLTIGASGGYSTGDGVVTYTYPVWSAPLNALALTVSWFLFARIIWTVSQGSDPVPPSGPATAPGPHATPAPSVDSTRP